MNCANCGMELSEARKLALPEETWCKECVEESGDVNPTKGTMIWSHKTAPELYLANQQAVDLILRSSRSGVHAQLPMSSKKEPAKVYIPGPLRERKEDLSLEVLNPPARCHPHLPRITPNGLCADCATNWYKIRLK